MTNEAQQIAAWLRRGANARADAEMAGQRTMHSPDWITMKDLADQIEAGWHLKDKHFLALDKDLLPL